MSPGKDETRICGYIYIYIYIYATLSVFKLNPIAPFMGNQIDKQFLLQITYIDIHLYTFSRNKMSPFCSPGIL